MTRKDLEEGPRAVQSTHAAINFIFNHPERAGPWWRDSNYLVQLEVENLPKLEELIWNCEQLLIPHEVFREPDLEDAITAIAIAPSDETQKLVKKIPLLFKDKIK